MTMKKAAIVAVKKAELIEAAIPELEAGYALVKVHAAPMCAEYKGFMEGEQSACLGHEAAGEIVALAEGVTTHQIGDRVVLMPLSACGRCDLCLSGNYIYCTENPMADCTMSQYIAKPAFLLKKIPDAISYEEASLACCGLGPTFGAMEEMKVEVFHTVLITGLGPVGLGAVINAKFRGAKVIAVDSNEYRSKLALELGADVVLDPRDTEIKNKINELTDRLGPHFAIDCSGAVPAHRLCIDVVRKRGAVAFVGESHVDTPVKISQDLIRKGIRLFGSWHYDLNNFNRIMQVISRSPVAKKLITHRFAMSDIQNAFETSSQQNSAKIILNPWE